MSNPLTDIQSELADTLLANPYFNNIPVLTQELGDIEQKINEAVGQLGGIVVVIVTPTANINWPDMGAAYFDRVLTTVLVIENVIVNRGSKGTGKAALDVAVMCALLLVHSPQPSGIFESIIADSPTIALAPDPTPNRTAYYVRLRTMCGAQLTVPQSVVADPVLVETNSGNGAVLTINTATPGTTVWYTLDGTYPNPQSGFLYTGPFAISPPVKVRCRGWIPGYKASKVIMQQINS